MRKSLNLFIAFALLFGNSAIGQISVSKDNLQQHVYALAADSMKGRGIGSKESKVAADYIIKQFESAGIKPFGNTYQHPFSFVQDVVRASGNNIIGIIEGSDPVLKNEYIVIGAHYDHIGYHVDRNHLIIFNGADDNASGVSTIIEVGRLLALQQEQLKRSVIIIAFDGEESGLEGSTEVVNDTVIPIQNVKVMISVDMVGMLKANKKLVLKGSATLNDGNTIFKEIAKDYGIELKGLGYKVEARTDTNPFGKIGIPAIAPNTGEKSPYHKPEDDAYLLDYDGMAKITGFLAESIIKVAAMDQVLPSKKFARRAKGAFSAGVDAGFGTGSFDFPDEFYQSKNILAAHVGLFGRVKLSKTIFIQPEVHYETTGGKIDAGTFRTHSIYTPCNLLVSLSSNDMFDQHFFVIFGGYYSYTFAGRVGGKNIDFESQFNRSTYGLNYGVSLEALGIHLSVTAKSGISNLFQDSKNGKINSQGVYMSFGFKF